MGNIKYILFDCMETLIDLTELPALKDYACWTFEGSGVEGYWKDFGEFFEGYLAARETLNEKYGKYREYETIERLRLIVRNKFPGIDPVLASDIIGKLNVNYWRTYKSKCYVKDDVKEVLPKLARCYRLGVVSNFMVSGGIEDLLRENGIIHNFDFVVTSINEGWRKPHMNIYEKALAKAGVSPSETVFVGDDYENDYITPGKMGMTSYLLDRSGRYAGVERRVSDFRQLAGLLL